MRQQNGTAVVRLADYTLSSNLDALHPLTRALLADVAALDARIRANADAEQIDVTLYVSRGRVARRPEVRVR